MQLCGCNREDCAVVVFNGSSAVRTILHNLFPALDKRNGSRGTTRNRLDWQYPVRVTYDPFMNSDANQPHNRKAVWQGLDRNLQLKFHPLTSCAPVLCPDDIGAILLGLPHHTVR